MAETGEMVAGATGLGAFLGALAGAWKFWKPAGNSPGKGGDMADVLQRVAILEQRANEAERRDKEAADRDEAIFSRLNDVAQKTSAILAIIDERRAPR